MNAEQKAWQAWQESPEGKRASNIETLKAPISQGMYLDNRLRGAFVAGMVAGKQIAADRVLAQQKRLIDEAVRSEP